MTEQQTSAPAADWPVVVRIWPLLCAAALGLVPFTVMSNFLPEIARDAGAGVDVIGGLRGLGGVAALLVGVLAAPLLDRLSRSAAAALAAAVMAVGCGFAVVGSTASWTVFCLLIGAGTAVLNPAVSALAADRFDDPATSARAATLVSSTMTLTAVLAAPVLVLPAMWWGWRGDMIGVVLALAALAVIMVRLRSDEKVDSGVGYLAAFRAVAALRGALGLIVVSLLRTAAFMGSLAYIAAAFDERFGLDTAIFAFVWSTSGVAFFLGNFFAGRVLFRRGDEGSPLMLIGGLVIGTVAMVLLYTSSHLAVAWAMVAVVSLSHAVVAAAVTTGLVRAAGTVRGTALSLNGAAQSLGVFAGAAVAAAGLAAGGWTAVGLCLGAATLVATGFAAYGSIRIGGRRAHP